MTTDLNVARAGCAARTAAASGGDPDRQSRLISSACRRAASAVRAVAVATASPPAEVLESSDNSLDRPDVYPKHRGHLGLRITVPQALQDGPVAVGKGTDQALPLLRGNGELAGARAGTEGGRMFARLGLGQRPLPVDVP